jgi:hypothetical protein
MSSDTPPQSEADIRDYLRKSLAAGIMRSEMDQFDFSLIYYDPALKMPFISFTPSNKRKD